MNQTTTARKQRNHVIAALVPGVALFALAAGVASAGDTKTYPGAMCIESGWSASGNIYMQPTAYPLAAGTAQMTFHCPIVRDGWVTGTQTGDVWVEDGHASQDVCCSSRSWNPTGTVMRVTANQCSSGTSSYTKLSLTGPSMSGTWSHRFFQCSVPPPDTYVYSGIRTYRSREH